MWWLDVHHIYGRSRLARYSHDIIHRLYSAVDNWLHCLKSAKPLRYHVAQALGRPFLWNSGSSDLFLHPTQSTPCSWRYFPPSPLIGRRQIGSNDNLAYTTYAFFEWALILFDVAFDAVTALDFNTFEISVKDVKGISKGYVQWLPR